MVTHNMVYLYDACDQISDFCHQQLLRKMWRKISWTDGRMDRGKTVYPPPPLGSGGIIKEIIYSRARKGTWKGLQLLQKSTISEIGIICACSDHGQSRYQIWIKCDKRQLTRCVHKMCEWTYGQTNMKRAISWSLYTLNIYAHFSSHFSQQLLMTEIWYLVTSVI
jgi:hypothetical protein